MLAKVLFTLFMFLLSLNGKVSTIKCYSCDALDKHLPMSDCYFIENTTSITTCSSKCLFFQYIVLEEEYNYYDTDKNKNTTLKGNVAHTVRSCAPDNITEACIVNSTVATVTRQCVTCDTDLCNESSRKNVPIISILLVLVFVFGLCAF